MFVKSHSHNSSKISSCFVLNRSVNYTRHQHQHGHQLCTEKLLEKVKKSFVNWEFVSSANEIISRRSAAIFVTSFCDIISLVLWQTASFSYQKSSFILTDIICLIHVTIRLNQNIIFLSPFTMIFWNKVPWRKLAWLILFMFNSASTMKRFCSKKVTQDTAVFLKGPLIKLFTWVDITNGFQRWTYLFVSGVK